MAYYPQQSAFPSPAPYNPYTPPTTFQPSPYATPASLHPNIYATPQQSAMTIPQYGSSHTPSTRHRSHSHSYSHSQPQVVYTGSGGHHSSTHANDYLYPTATGYRDGGSHRRSHSTAGTTHYAAPSSSHSHSHSHRRSSDHPSSSQARRSHSTTRHAGGQTITVYPKHHSQPVYIQNGHRRRSSELTVGDRIRRLFGIGPSRSEYIDARTGRQVDIRGRPINRY